MNKLQGNIIATVIATILLAACGKLVDNIVTPPFVFVTDRHRGEDFNSEIYYAASVGEEPIRITDNMESDRMPAWSPSGSRIAFYSVGDDGYDIYTMVFSGGGKINLTDSPGFDVSPVWSTDGTKIAFFSQRPGGSGVYVMNEDGSDQKMLAEGDHIADIQWSQDGLKIAFLDGLKNLFVMDSDGENLENVTENYQNTGVDFGIIRRANSYSISPDGTMIALGYQSFSYDVVVLLDDGKTIRHRMLDEMVSDTDPVFSPDGKSLVFIRENLMCLIDAVEWDTDSIVCHETNVGGIHKPKWSRDSKFIAFLAISAQENGSRASNIYVMRADGSELFTITDDTDVMNYEFEWAPGYPEPDLY